MKARGLLHIPFCLALAACSPVASHTATHPPLVDQDHSVVLSGEQRRSLHISTVKVEQKLLPELVQTSGQVEADANMSTPVMSPAAGRIEEVGVRLGDSVKTGQVLARLHSDDVAQIESDLLKAVLDIEADREQNKVELALADANYSRKKTLVDQGIAARADLEAAQHDFEKAKAALAALEIKRTGAITCASERLRLFGVPSSAVGKLIATKTIDNRFEIKAPRSGVVGTRDANPGQLVDTAKPLFVITDLSNVWLVAQAFEKSAARISVGQPVEVTVDSYPGQKFRGRIDYVADAIDPNTRTLSVRATVENRHRWLKPQMFGRISVGIGTARVLAVPQAAVHRTGEVDLAYVPVSESRFQERRLSLGATFGPYVAVESGLKSGELVVVDGSLELNGQSLLQKENEP